ncbi:MAG: 2-amino-4-hydroxy-6-hydroxymethyldihydropteridine diphosphokinase [Candidatus Kapaibacterium sp.]
MVKRTHSGEPILAWLGLGANLGDRAATIRRSLEAIGSLPETTLTQVSSLYLTPPLGPPDQPEYINCVAQIETTLPPLQLLQKLKAVEKSLGRKERERWREREIDIDILFYGDKIVQQESLQIPHPELQNRPFVLVPLAEITPELLHPILKKKVAELLLLIDVEGVVKWGEN